MEGIFCDSRLLCFHYSAFLMATIFDVIVLVLQAIETKLHSDSDRPTEVKYRLQIAVNLFSLSQTASWFVCQCLMLHVFRKFGRPVERDAMHLFRTQLETLYQNANDPDA